MSKKNIIILQILFFVFAAANGAFVNFINLHLEQVVGLTGSEIGFVASMSMIAMMVMNPVWGYIGDKTGKYVFLLKVAWALAVLTAVFYFNSRTLSLVVAASVLLEGGRAALFPFLDLIASNYCEENQFNFGKIRVFASLGFMSFSMLTGFFIAGLQIPWFDGATIGFDGFMSLEFATFGIFITLNILGLAFSFLMPKSDAKNDDQKRSDIEKMNKEDAKQLLKNKKYLYIVVFSMISLVTMEAVHLYSAMHLVTELGAPENIVSWLVMFMVTPEFILLPLGVIIVKKFGFKNWYIFALLTMILRLGVYSLTTNVMLFVLVSASHGVMICMSVTGNIAYMRKVVEPRVRGLAFTILASSMALSRAILSFIFGWIYENISSFAVFRTGTVILLIALAMVIFSKSLNEVGKEIEAS